MKLNRSRSRLGLLTLILTLGCGASGTGSSVAYGSGLPRVDASPAIAKQEEEMFKRLNRDRKERGLPALGSDPRLSDVARFHSADMRDRRFFSHDSPTSGSLEDRLNAAGYLFLTARENLAEAPDVQSGQDNLLRSPGHYANIIATDTTRVGIGIVPGGVSAPENLTITQIFATPGRAESPADARRALIENLQTERRRRGLPPAKQHPLLDQLAQDHIGDLSAENSPSSLQAAGERISEAVAAGKEADLRGITVGAQLLPDSDSFEAPRTLLTEPNARFGLAVRKTLDPAGRPMLQLLLIVAR